jgi:segregation and condensation protein A
LAGEFLVMAATLLQIKARTLLPAPAAENEEDADPRTDLVRRLLEYQRFKEASKVLETRLAKTKDIHYRGSPLIGDMDYHLEASLFDLLDAFRDVLKNLKPDVREIVYEEVPIEVKIREILAFLGERDYATFREILQRETTRRGLIVTFLAILELIRLRQIAALQTEMFGEIRIHRRTSADEPPAPATPAEPEPTPSADPLFRMGTDSSEAGPTAASVEDAPST